MNLPSDCAIAVPSIMAIDIPPIETLGFWSCIREHLIPAGTASSQSLFGIPDYLAALSLLLVIYTISDFRVKFRLSLAGLPIFKLGFWIFLGSFVLKGFAELWFQQHWLVFPFLDNRLLVDAVLLSPCMAIIIYWVYVAYISPPTFSWWNSDRFFWAYERVAHNGTAEELRVALQELTRSAEAIVRACPEDPARSAEPNITRKQRAAYELLLLLGNRRLCAEVAESSPATAGAFFRTISDQKKFQVPFHIFARNVSAEFLSNKSSPIFHEDSGYESGWSGYAQTYSNEIFANPQIIIGLTARNSSPLDINFRVQAKWDAENWEAYTRVVLIYIRRCLQQSPRFLDDFSIRQIFDTCNRMTSGAHRLNGVESFYEMDEFQKIRVSAAFIRNLLELLDEHKVPIESPLKHRDGFRHRTGLHEQLAELLFEVIFDVSSVQQPAWTCHYVAHNTMWSGVFGFQDTKTSRWMLRRVSRLIYNEIRDMDKFFNFRGAGYVGFCLNVLGVHDKRFYAHARRESPLRLAVLSWVRRNYMRMREESPKVAEACLHGSISFDPTSLEIVKTYSNETGNAPSETRFKVDPL